MMMGGMGYGIVWASILATALLLGYAYIIWILANKESGGWKLTGQILAGVIAVIAVIMFIYCGIYAPMRSRGMCGGMMTPEKKMIMEKMQKEMPGMMHKMPGGMEKGQK
ncbi:MAG TPA: hypothetical protein VMD02_04450 [Candidatus Omnitrophota bacterium]|nr:hypothetical protein [Candidatus Omnitrophota bacterium]